MQVKREECQYRQNVLTGPHLSVDAVDRDKIIHVLQEHIALHYVIEIGAGSQQNLLKVVQNQLLHAKKGVENP